MQFADEDKIKLKMGTLTKHKLSTFREEATAPGLLAAKLPQAISPKGGRKEALGVCWKASGQAQNAHSLMCRSAQLRNLTREKLIHSRGGDTAHRRP